jgi:hypothetical protein
MTFPLPSSIEIALATELLIALALGVAFGFVLERAGFGSGCKLTAVFYGFDMSVTKVMFTAGVTALAGLWALAALGVLALGELYIVPTSYVAQIVGGFLFAIGFVVGGYCPGTSVVACAAGRLDAWVFVLGILAGVAIYAQAMPGVEEWIRAHATPDLTLPSLTGVAMGWWVLFFVAVLVLAGWGMGAAERAFAHLRPSRD